MEGLAAQLKAKQALYALIEQKKCSPYLAFILLLQKVILRRPDKYNYKNKSNFVSKNKQKVWHRELHFCRKLLNIIFEPAEAYNVILDCNSSLNSIISDIN